MSQAELLDDLEKRTLSILERLRPFVSLEEEELNEREAPGKWNVLECFEHLNLYGNFYLPEIARRIEAATPGEHEAEFVSGWLGNYFALSMLPGEQGKLNKMKTFANMNPINKKLDKNVLAVFAEQQHQLLDLIRKARQVNLSKVKTAISISKWIRLRLGDTLRVVIYHNERHVLQAERALHSITAS